MAKTTRYTCSLSQITGGNRAPRALTFRRPALPPAISEPPCNSPLHALVGGGSVVAFVRGSISPSAPGLSRGRKPERISRHFFPFNSLISVTSSGHG